MRPRDLALGILGGLVITAVLFPRALAGRESLVPAAILVEDPVFQPGFPTGQPKRAIWDTSGALVHYPALTVAARELRRGRLPLWNPHVGAGAPLLAEAHSAPLSPFLLPFLIAPSEQTYTWALLLRVVVGAGLMFAFVRGQGGGRAGAALAAVTLAAGGTAMVRFDLPTEGTAVALLPLLAAASAAAAAGRRGVAALAAATLLAFLSAHPELAALAAAGGAVAGLVGSPRPAALARVAAGLALGLAASAVVLVPLIAYLAGDGATYKLDPALAAAFGSDVSYLRVAPDLLRVGGALFPLAALALLGGGAAARAPARALAVLATGVVALFVVQRYGPVGARGLLPAKYGVFLVVFALAWLAAVGLDDLASAGPRRLGLALLLGAAGWAAVDALTLFHLERLPDVIVGDAILVAAVVLAAWRPRLAVLLPALALLAFAVSARRTTADTGRGVPDTAAARALGRLAPPGRVAGLERCLFPNTASLLGLDDARGLAAVFPARYRGYMSLVEGVRTQPTYSLLRAGARSRLLDLLGVTVLVTRPALVPAGWPVVYHEEGVAISRNPDALPRAFIPADLEAAAGPAASLAALRRLRDEAALPRRAVVEAPAAALAPLQGGGGEARVVLREPGRVVVDVAVASAGLLVLTDTWARGWRATVDGALAPIYPTLHLFRGVPVAAGRHRVVFEYRPPEVRWGLALSAAALLAILWLARPYRERICP